MEEGGRRALTQTEKKGRNGGREKDEEEECGT